LCEPPPSTRCSTLSLHDALPILPHRPGTLARALAPFAEAGLNLTKLESRPDRSTPWEYLFYLDVEARADEPAMRAARAALAAQRSEEHTSELQSRGHLVCRLLLE